MSKVIGPFKGPWRFLSNFWPCEICYAGLTFASVEAAYQAAKTLDQTERARFVTMDAKQAKRAGKKLVLRSDWDAIKLALMTDLVRQKFLDPELQTKLLVTGDDPIVELNAWRDTYWGVCKGVGENHLGRILMAVRDELRGT